ncbi:AAA family ATPase [uncultured Lacinutrix sp.]|uniref:AAA family ATPase n=1 Tax=uncultured Lacinutrix sp. TaxID=574032 RepID=UPI00261C02D8|nr:AAA family ATPase [uncultured Lacinutrix sp.]
MRLAAIYIEDNFLFEEPQTINFGGKFIYDFTDIRGITRVENHGLVENLYDQINLSLVSAIVGKNGSGKTTLLRYIISFLKGKGYGSDYILIVEDNNITYTLCPSLGAGYDFTERKLDINLIETLYYSPYLDFKEPLDGVDLSFDTILEEDIEASKNKFVANEDVNLSRWLKAKNSIRIFEFQISKYAIQLQTVFDFPKFERARFSFIRYKLDIDYDKDRINFHNTPFDLQYAIHTLYKLISDEGREINKNRPKGYSHVILQKNLLKNYLLEDLLSLFIIQMEKKNQYLQEGHLEITNKEYTELINDLDPKEALFKLLELHYFQVGSQKIALLPVDETKQMINYLFDVIDGLEAENDRDTRNFDWNSKSIYLNNDQAIQLIEYHTSFLNKVDQYYGGIKEKGEVIFSKRERIEGLISYEPSERDLSSGETALLNFYSRIYYYFKKQYLDINSISKKDFYVLLLDEADMGFHPKWRKSFVKSITTFLPYFFKDLRSEIQIIFTTHDPITLSDLPNNQIIYLNKKEGKNIILNQEEKPVKSFGANVHDLLAHSFFLEDGFMGEFAQELITDLINFLTFNEKKEESEENIKHLKDWNPARAQKVIDIIDEPLIQERIQSLHNKKFLFKDKELLAQKIREMEVQLAKLNK